MCKLFKKVRNILGAIDCLISGIITIALYIIANMINGIAAFVNPIDPWERDKIPNKFSYRVKKSGGVMRETAKAFNAVMFDKENKENKETEEEES